MSSHALCRVVAIVMLCASPSLAQSKSPWPVADYAAADDPTNQNWSAYEYDPTTSIWANAVFDAAHGTNVWMTHIDAGMQGGGIRYVVELPDNIASLAEAHGWTAETRMRASGTPEGSGLAVGLKERTYYLLFYSTDSVHAYLLAATNLSQLTPGPPFVGHWVNTSAAYADYHTFGMAYDPASDAVSVSVDGSVVLTDYRGMPSHIMGEQSAVTWGAGGTYVYDETYWMNVSFSVALPRPTISGFQLSPSNTVAVEWFAWSDLLYRVDRSESLTAPSWDPVGLTVTGENSTVAVPVETGETNRNFFRLQTWPQE